MRPMAPGIVLWVNHRFPSGPAVMSRRLLPETGNSFVTIRAVVTRPILSSVPSANQRAPSGPEVMPCGSAPPPMAADSAMANVVSLMRPIRSRLVSVK